MKTSIATVCLSGTLPEKLAAIAAAGFSGIEIFEQDFIAFDGSPREVGQMVADHGLDITLFQPFRDFEGLPGPLRRSAFDRIERKFDLMQELGTDLVLVCSSVHAEAQGGIDRMAADFAELGARAGARNLRVGYEALAWGRHVSDHRDAWEVVRRADHPNVGLILDSFHTLARKIDPATIRRIPGDKVFFVQLADAPLIDMDLLYWSRHFRSMPGEGDLDVVGFLRAVMATGYAGPLSLEVFNDQFRGGSPRQIASDGHRSLLYLMDQVARLDPDMPVDVPQMPPRIEVKGVSFVEFAADETEAQAMTALLRTMGFRLQGRHVSKDVQLWQQGAARVILNMEREGFAHASHIAHGLNVCDLGLEVSDAGATVVRARVLGASPFHQPVGPGETDIPAIRGVGGGILHFIDDASALARVWGTDFERVGDADDPGGPGGAGLIRIDHVAQTMNYEEMLTWALFYISIFDLEKQASVDVVDPGGLVRSQAIESPDGRFRLTLNGAETHRTLAGRFIADSFGSSVQHIAFETDDIRATAKALRSTGFRALEISANYYDDLAARFGLDASIVAELRDLNLLYDRDDAGGSFLQLYSLPFGDGMFFELVERRGGYGGYGGPNAPFRIAAQRRHMRHFAVPAR